MTSHFSNEIARILNNVVDFKRKISTNSPTPIKPFRKADQSQGYQLSTGKEDTDNRVKISHYQQNDKLTTEAVCEVTWNVPAARWPRTGGLETTAFTDPLMEFEHVG